MPIPDLSTRHSGDSPTQRQMTFADRAVINNKEFEDAVHKHVSEILNRTEGRETKLKVNKTWVYDPYDFKDHSKQLEIRNKGRTWSSQLRGDVSLIDKSTNKQIDRLPNVKLADIPKYTPRRTFLVGGNEYQFTNQERLKPGIFTRVADNGDVESFFNVDKTVDYERGFNNNFRLIFEPKRKSFFMNYGTKNVPLYNVMHALGVEDHHLERAWGHDVLQANRDAYLKSEPQNLGKMYEAIHGTRPPKDMDIGQIKTAIKDRLTETKMDPQMNMLTIGKPYDKVSALALLDAAKKIVQVNKGEVQPDDRDSILFKSIHGPAEFISEHLIKNTKPITRNIGIKLDTTRKLSKSLSSDIFNKYITGYLTQSQLSSPPGEVNVVSILGNDSKLTIMGEGGVKSAQGVSDNARDISPTKFGFIDPTHTPEGNNIGLVTHQTMGTIKDGSTLKRSFHTLDGKFIAKSANEIYDKYVAFPDQYKFEAGKNPKPTKGTIKVLHRGEIKEVPSSKVDLVFPGAYSFFDTTSNSIPFLSSLQGNRALTAGKMQEQALSLKHREAPHFSIVDEYGRSISDSVYEDIATERAPVSGTVKHVGSNHMVITSPNGDDHTVHLYNHFPLNQEAFIHHTPVVSVGDKVKKGQLVADTNNTRDGHLAIGTNMHVAYMPWHGLNFEDAGVITESGAKKLTSEHLYDLKAKRSAEGVFHRDKYKAHFPDEVNSKVMKKLDKEGVVKVGEVLEHGDIAIAHMEKNKLSGDDLTLGRLDKSMRNDYRNEAVRWTHEVPGVVTNVEKHGNQIVVNVKTEEQLQIADKIAGLHGNKTIISKIIPDDEAPTTPDGTRIDLILNPAGVPGRINTSQLMEALAGRIAEKTGKKYDIHNFATEDQSRKLLEDMKKAGIGSDKDYLMDSATGKPFKNPVFHGTAHIMKLEHKVDHKFGARYRDGYDANMQPSRSGEEKAKGVGQMELNVLMAHDAMNNIQEMNRLKGQRNDEWWLAFEMGHQPPPLKPTFAWEKQMGLMKALGANVQQDNTGIKMRPLTDKDVLELSNGQIKDPTQVYRKKDLAPERNGLFDPFVTGGMQGTKWGHIDLAEPIPNPVAGRAIPSILDITQKQYQEIIEGKQYVNKTTGSIQNTAENGLSGGPAIKRMLQKVSVDEIPGLIKQAKVAKATDLDKINRRIKYLDALKKNDLKPTDYVLTKIPVVPPQYRPISQLSSGSIVISDINELYRDIGLVNRQLGDMKDMPEVFKKDLHRDLYDSVSAAMGFGDPVSYSSKFRGLKGAMKQIDGGDAQSKLGFFQNKVIRKNQDLVGRSTVIPDPTLGPDEVGLPRDMANKIFQGHIMRKITGLGYKPLEAQKMIKENDPIAKKALDSVAQENLVLINRAPSLHKYSMLATHPIIVEGKAVKIPNLIVAGMSMDFDGDTVQIHVPVGKEAVNEAYKMLPSANVIKFGHGDFLHLPSKEAVLGAYLSSKPDGKSDKKYQSSDQIVQDVEKRDIDYATEIDLNGKKATAGIHVINSVLKPEDRRYDLTLDKKGIRTIVSDVNKKYGGRKALDVADKIKEVGNYQATIHGHTIGVSDTVSSAEFRDAAIKKAEAKVNSKTSIADYSKAFIGEADTAIKKNLEERLEKEGNPLNDELKSGAGKGIGSIAQIMATPMLVQDHHGNVIRHPINNSYSEGLTIADYMAASIGARKGNVDKSVQTYMPGWLTKDLVPTTYSTIIKRNDSGDHEGLEFQIDDKHGMDRYLAQPVYDKKNRKIADRNELVDQKLINKLKIAGIGSYRAQSPLTDPTPSNAMGATSFGLGHDGQRLRIGSNIGVQSAHVISEPSTQLVLRSFHTGGTVAQGGGLTTAFDRIDQILRMPKEIKKVAVFSEHDGIVKEVKPSSLGGYDVKIGDHNYYIEAGLDPKVKIGSAVKSGDIISTGVINPHELLEHKGMKAVQEHMVSEISKLHSDNGMHLDHRPIEVIVRSLTNNTRIMNPGSSHYLPGDTANITSVEKFNKELEHEVHPRDAVDNYMAQDAGPLRKGTLVTPDGAKLLMGAGYSKIKVSKDPIIHKPFLKGIAYNVEGTTDDILTRLGHSHLKSTIMEGATQGFSSSFEGDSPIPALSYGSVVERQKKLEQRAKE